MSAVQHAPVHRSADAARAWRGAALLSRGFRPFFLGAGVWALVGMALWPAVFSGAVTIPTAFSTVDWHAHEMIFGYGAAVVGGLPADGDPQLDRPLAGRRRSPRRPCAALGGGTRRRVRLGRDRPPGRRSHRRRLPSRTRRASSRARSIAGRNWRNLTVAALALALGLANVAFHVEDAREGLADFSIRAALGLFVMLILLIGGRVTPSFTGNWIARDGRGRAAGADRAGRRNRPRAVGPGARRLGGCARGRSRPASSRSQPAPAIFGACRAGGGLRPAATHWCWCCTRVTARRARLRRGGVERLWPAADSLCGRRARLGDRRGRRDDAGDDDAGDARPYRTRRSPPRGRRSSPTSASSSRSPPASPWRWRPTRRCR